MRQLLCTLLLLCTAFAMQAQSTLSAGDIAFTGFNSDNPDDFSFVLLTDVESGTTIRFTDNGWQSSGSFRSNEGTVDITFNVPVVCGVEVFANLSTSQATVSAAPVGSIVDSDAGFALSGSGDQILAYQGMDASPTFIAAVHFNGNGFEGDATDSNTSALPTGLTVGVDAVAIPETDNGVYDCSNTTSGTVAEVRMALNTAANWTTSNSNVTVPSGCTYSLSDCGAVAPTGCDELFISEYVEGGSLNKCIEIYNPTDATIDLLGAYELVFYSNGSISPGTTIPLTGTVASGDVYVVCDDGADAQLLAESDQTPTSSFFNGNDVVALTLDDVIIDVIGQIGNDADFAEDVTLRRNSDVTSGDTNGGDTFDANIEWTSFPNNTFDGIGSHTSDCIDEPTCSITNVVITEGPTCDGDDSFFDISFDVSGGSGEYTIITPGAELYGTALATGITDGTVMAEGQANAPASVMEGTMAEVVIVDAVNETCQSTPIDIFIPVCPPVTCAEEGDIFINEIHYDNIGTDVNEFVEVAVANVADIDVADFTVTFYNGSNGTSYNSETLDNFVEGEDDGTYTYYSLTLPSNGIQNGAPDGLALSCTEALVEFLSYEGTFEAADGPAAGETSEDIGVAEGSGTGEFASLQLVNIAPTIKQWTVTECNTKGFENEVVTAPSAAAVGVGTKTFCKSDDLTPSLANTGISVDFSLAANEKIVWALFSVPAGSSYSVGDEFTTDDCGDAFKNFGDFAVANSSKVIRVQDIANIMPGTYSFEVFVENCATGCRSISEIGFSITVNEATSVMITADPDGDLCLGQEGVQYGANITSTDGGTYTYAWCAYNSGDGSGTCFNGFDDNTAAMPTRDWTTSAGAKSVGVTVMSDNPGCTAEDLYSFEVVAPTMVECPADQMATLITDSETFDCVAEVTFNNPSVEMTPCIPTLTISIDGGAPETVVPGEPYTFMTDDLGEYEVTYTLTDQVGNESTCSFTIFVDGLPCGFVDDGGIGECAGSNPTSMFDQDAEAFAVTSNGCVPEFPYIEDEQGFAYTQLCGDGYIEVFVDNITNKGIGGIQLRESTAPGSKKVEIATDRVARLFRSVRVVDNYPAFPQQILSFDKFWLKIERTGNTFKASASVDGVMYIPYVFQTVQMSECLVAGMFATSTNEEDVVTATFTNVTVSGGDVDGLQSVPQTVAQSNTADANLSIGLAPNPAKEQVTLNMDQLIGEAATISIFNINGQLMNTVQYDSVENASETLNISNLPAGTYFVNVRTAQEQQTLRLIKQ